MQKNGLSRMSNAKILQSVWSNIFLNKFYTLFNGLMQDFTKGVKVDIV
jgi:hypothetical protein